MTPFAGFDTHVSSLYYITLYWYKITIKIVNMLFKFFGIWFFYYCLTGVNEMGFTWSDYTDTHVWDTFNTRYKNTTI